MDEQDRLLQIQMWEKFVKWIKSEQIFSPAEQLVFDQVVERFAIHEGLNQMARQTPGPGFLKEEAPSGMCVSQPYAILDMPIKEFITRERMGHRGVQNFVRVLNIISRGAEEDARNLSDVRVIRGDLKPTRDHRYPSIKTVRDLINCRASDLLNMPNYGKQCLADIRKILAEVGLKLRDD